MKRSKLAHNDANQTTGAPAGLLPHQELALDLLWLRHWDHRACYLRLDPGLGKTIIAAAYSKLFLSGSIVFISPPSLTANVEAEFRRWAPNVKIQIIADNRLGKLSLNAIDLLIVDEAHRFNNEKSQRTKAFFKIASKARKIVFMSGTPAPNSRPVELWPILTVFAKDAFPMTFFEFGKRFCDAKQIVIGYDHLLRRPKKAWKFDGESNLEDFRRRLYRSFMIRMRKDKLDLPPKLESILTVGDGVPPKIARFEQAVAERLEASGSDTAREWVAALKGLSDVHQSTYLKLLGEHKLQYVLPIIDTYLAETKENLLIFAVHTTVIDGLKKHLANYNPIVIDGKVPQGKRKLLVDEFQTNTNRRVAILNVQAGGIGWTLTKADRVLFVEWSWKDGDNEQASDRAHRIGRKSMVNVQYVVLKDSIDARRMGVVLAKRASSI